MQSQNNASDKIPLGSKYLFEAQKTLLKQLGFDSKIEEDCSYLEIPKNKSSDLKYVRSPWRHDVVDHFVFYRGFRVISISQNGSNIIYNLHEENITAASAATSVDWSAYNKMLELSTENQNNALIEPDPVSEKKQKQQQLYIRAYQNQEFWHSARKWAGRLLAVLAAVVPPLSLFASIKRAAEIRKDCLQGKTKVPVWTQVLICCFFAIVPVLSGYAAWQMLETMANRNRRKDNIILNHTTDSLNAIRNHSIKRHQIKVCSSYTNTNWEDIKTSNKPSKAVSGNDIYMDKAQKKRWENIEKEHNCLTSWPISIFDPTFFKQSQEKSVAIGKNLEKKFGLRSAKL